MERVVVVVAAVVSMLVGSAASAGAVTGNYTRDFDHTGVGLLVTYDEDREFAGRCSGTMISQTAFLTAGHCTFDAVTARVYFEQDAGADYDPVTDTPATSGYPYSGGIDAVAIHTMPGYDDFATFPDTQDIGLVILDADQMADLTAEVGNLQIASLLDVGYLDDLAARGGKRHVSFTVSGYGVNWINGAQTVSLRERMTATASLTNLRSSLTDGYNLAHSGDPGRGKGGTCFGDSGGPVFLAGTTTIAAVTSFGLSAITCTGPGFAYRVDQEAVVDWIEGLLPAGEELQISAP
jgi:hypothetical protein